jgi:hypothetical protein
MFLVGHYSKFVRLQKGAAYYKLDAFFVLAGVLYVWTMPQEYNINLQGT